MIFLKIFGTMVGIYAGVSLSNVAISWLRELFRRMKPDHYK